jgi:hypothetical protein
MSAHAASYLWGRLVPRIGRAGCMAIATAVHIVFYMLMLIVSSNKMLHTIHYQSGAAYVTPSVAPL